MKVLEHLLEGLSIVFENAGEKQILLFCSRSHGEEEL